MYNANDMNFYTKYRIYFTELISKGIWGTSLSRIKKI